MKLIERL